MKRCVVGTHRPHAQDLLTPMREHESESMGQAIESEAPLNEMQA